MQYNSSSSNFSSSSMLLGRKVRKGGVDIVIPASLVLFLFFFHSNLSVPFLPVSFVSPQSFVVFFWVRKIYFFKRMFLSLHLKAPGTTYFRDAPVRMTCPQCHNEIVSAVEYESGSCTWLACLGLSVVGKWPCIWLVVARECDSMRLW